MLQAMEDNVPNVLDKVNDVCRFCKHFAMLYFQTGHARNDTFVTLIFKCQHPGIFSSITPTTYRYLSIFVETLLYNFHITINTLTLRKKTSAIFTFNFWYKHTVFWLKFHCSFFSIVQLTIVFIDLDNDFCWIGNVSEGILTLVKFVKYIRYWHIWITCVISKCYHQTSYRQTIIINESYYCSFFCYFRLKKKTVCLNYSCGIHIRIAYGAIAYAFVQSSCRWSHIDFHKIILISQY